MLLLSGLVAGLPTAAPAAADPDGRGPDEGGLRTGTCPSLRKMVITVSSDEGHEKARWIAGVTRTEFPNGKRSLIVGR
jgi:hypothetical protein